MKYEKLAKDIIENVGGKENVNSVVHCVTRLRFRLKDEGKANTEVLKNMDGVVTVMKSGGQYQVVIGNHVPDVYKDVVQVGGFQSETPVDENTGEKQNLFNRFIDMISGIFTPVLGVLAAAGMIKGFNALFLALKLYPATSGTNQLLTATGDALFYFFPIFLGYTAMVKFGGNKFIGMAIGGALVYPALTAISAGEPLYTVFTGTMFESPIYITFLGIPVILMSYASSVIPIIISAFFASKVQKGLAKIIPDVVKTFLVPFFTLLIVVPLTFLIIGPIATWAGLLLGQITLWIINLSPIIAGLFLGGLWQVFVIFGLHWGLVPIAINNMMTMGEDPILAIIFAASFAQTGAVLGVWLKTKNQKLKALSIPAFISGIFGVTEPAIYGVTLPKKTPFIISCIVAAVGGVIAVLFNSKNYILGGFGIFGYPSFIHPTEGITSSLWGGIIGSVVAFVLGFILTYLFGLKKEELVTEATATSEAAAKAPVQSQSTSNTKAEDIVSPFTGEVRELASIEDAAFASGALGKGVAIEPTEGKLFSPVSGTVSVLFPSQHAIGITTDEGAEILIHVGMDTVQLNGKYFTAHTAQGKRIEKGELLLEFDIAGIKEAGYPVTTPVVVTNFDQFNIETTKEKQIKPGEQIIKVQPK